MRSLASVAHDMPFMVGEVDEAFPTVAAGIRSLIGVNLWRIGSIRNSVKLNLHHLLMCALKLLFLWKSFAQSLKVHRKIRPFSEWVRIWHSKKYL